MFYKCFAFVKELEHYLSYEKEKVDKCENM